MGAYKDEKRGTWYANFYYTDYNGKKKAKLKRGFATKREALEFEREFLGKHLGNKPDMKLTDFVNELYLPYLKQRTKQVSYMLTKSVIERQILPLLGNFRLGEIDNARVIWWQNTLMEAKSEFTHDKFAPCTLRMINGKLSAILNFAVKNHGLEKNPCAIVGSMGSFKSEKEMLIWTPEEYEKFREAIKDNMVYFTLFETLYWTGMRKGEALALTEEDIDFVNNTININKTYHKIDGKDVFTSPKTNHSIRKIKIPEFLAKELREYIDTLDAPKQRRRLFMMTASALGYVLERYALLAQVKRIRVHDLRHSHVSLLINKGFSAVEIGKRVGHAAVEITYHYSHLFPNADSKLVGALDNVYAESINKGKETE